MDFVALQLIETYEAANSIGVVATMLLLLGVIVLLVVPAVVTAFLVSLRSEARTRQSLFDELQRRSAEIAESRETEAERRSEFKRFSDEQLTVLQGLAAGFQKLPEDIKTAIDIQAIELRSLAGKNYEHLTRILAVTESVKDTQGEISQNVREVLAKVAAVESASSELRSSVLELLSPKAEAEVEVEA